MEKEQQQKNLSMLKEADSIQDKTLEALQRAQRDAAETEGLGIETLQELGKQGDQMDTIDTEVDRAHHKLETSSRLQKQFERWTGNILNVGHIFGGSSPTQGRNAAQFSKIKEVFEDQNFDTIFRSWKPHALVECANPAKDCSDLFDPAVAAKMEHSSWIIDYSMASIDSEGWTYATTYSALNSFAGGQASPQFNSFVRRRKWRYGHHEGARGSSPMDEMLHRNEKRKITAAEDAKPVKRVGYVPRDRQESLTDTGLTSAGLLGRSSPPPVELDPESAAGMARLESKDAQIDQGLDALGRSIDNIHSISNAMKQEVTHQVQRLDHLEGNLEVTANKQHEVNARERHLLNTN